MRSPFAFAQYGESGTWVCDKLPHIARHVDDIALHQILLRRVACARTGDVSDEHGLDPRGFPERGIVGNLRPWDRKPGSAWLRGPAKQPRQQRRGGQLGRRLPADGLPGDRLPVAGLADPQPEPARRLEPRSPAPHARPDRRGSTAATPSGIPARPIYSPASKTTSWPTACSPRRSRPSTSRAEPTAIKQLYGLDDDVTRPFGEKCLLARRLVERGVRFVQVYCNDEWDAHNDLADNHGERCRETDKPVAGLLADLKQRGLLDSTLVDLGRRVRPDARV